jgi:Uma2 family endonuclease
MASITRPMTVEEFREMPEGSGQVYHELRHGEVVAVTRPKHKHFQIQRRLRELLTPLAEPGSCVDSEIAYRPLPENELWVADVAYVTAERYRDIQPNDNLHGAPELVVKVLSPSNTVSELYEKERICLVNGAREFWVIDPDLGQIKVTTPDGRTVTYQSDAEIAVPFGTHATVKVADILHYPTR